MIALWPRIVSGQPAGISASRDFFRPYGPTKKWTMAVNSQETVLAICIPTFNRARYLNNLLKCLSEDLNEFPYPYEIIISNNASDDKTEEIVLGWKEKLPIRYYKQESNIGPFRNLRFILEESTSKYSMLLADDDLIDVDGLKNAIGRLLNEPDAAIVYAPWTLFDLVNNKTITQFYEIPNDVIINQGNFLHLLTIILQHHIFAEIAIVHTETYQNLMPRENDLAYWSFTVPAEYLTLGKILFLKTPFYKSVTKYFADEGREQHGHGRAEDAWDHYRGGLEHLLGLSRPHLTEDNVAMLRDMIGKFVVNRMLVALKLRINASRNPIDTYYLASRLRGLGAESRLPTPFEVIRAQAALWFVTHDENLLEGARQIVLVGGFEQSIADFLGTISDLKLYGPTPFPGTSPIPS